MEQQDVKAKVGSIPCLITFLMIVIGIGILVTFIQENGWWFNFITVSFAIFVGKVWIGGINEKKNSEKTETD